ncbi:MAG: LPS export ABC transporter periplasmic protein LptC [Chitinophagaceae bacterium]|nr:LPS export ABC transporter periplasmic protein LptC [Chitinophagaceae bacterium]
MNTYRRIGLSALFVLMIAFAFAQQKTPVTPSAPAPQDSTKNINLIRSNVLRFEQKDSTELQVLVGNVILKQANTLFYGDSIVMDKAKNVIEVFGNIHINDSDSVNVYSQYLIYYGNTKIANLKKAVKLTDGKAILTTEELEYDLNSKTGTYLNGGKIVNGSSVLTSKEGYYYADSKDAYFKKNVKMVDPNYTMATDTLLYNTQTQIATFVAPTTINDGKSIIRTSDGYYDMNRGLANFGSRPTIQDSTQFITADSISFDKNTGEGVARGNFLYRDTVQGVTVISEYGIFNRDTKTFMATEKPLMIIKQDNDSLFLTADTLYSGIRLDTTYVEDSLTKNRLAKKEVDIKTGDSAKIDIKKPMPQVPLRGNIAGKPARGARPPEGTRKNLPGERPGNNNLPPPDVKKDIPPPADTSKAIAAQINPVKDSLVASPKNIGDSSGIDSLSGSIVLSKAAADSILRKDSIRKQDSIKAMAARKIDRIDSVRFFMAYRHVKMFEDSMQAVCDSMFFSGKDSIFRLYTDPVVWSKESQISGDTIHLYTKNKKPERVEVWENAFSISKSNDQFFNQLKGNTINGFFKDGDIDYIRAKGSAESLYYMQDDDSAYTGANYAQADLINLYFVKKELDKISWLYQVEGGFYPVNQIPEERQRFRNFKWREARRPKTRAELYQ